MRLYETRSLNFIHFIIVVYVLGSCWNCSSCLNMWTSMEKRQATSQVKKGCLSPCKLFPIMCKNDGKCRQRGSDCTWYCECPKNCKGFFCETIINTDEEAPAQDPGHSDNLENPTTNVQWFGQLDKKALKDILTKIQKNPEEVRKTEPPKKDNKKTVCPPNLLNITSTNNPKSVTEKSSENVTSAVVTKPATLNTGIETSTPVPIVRSTFTTTDSPPTSTGTIQSSSKSFETSTVTSSSTDRLSKSKKTIKEKVLSRKAKPLEELIEEAIAIIPISTAKPSRDTTVSTPDATSSASKTRGVSSTTDTPHTPETISETHVELNTPKKQKDAATTTTTITITTEKKQMRPEQSTTSKTTSTTQSADIKEKDFKTETTTSINEKAKSAPVSEDIAVEKKQAGKTENNLVKNNNSSTKPSNTNLVEKSPESIKTGPLTKSIATSKKARQTTTLQMTTVSSTEAPLSTTTTPKSEAQSSKSLTTTISTSEAPQTTNSQTTTISSSEAPQTTKSQTTTTSTSEAPQTTNSQTTTISTSEVPQTTKLRTTTISTSEVPQTTQSHTTTISTSGVPQTTKSQKSPPSSTEEPNQHTTTTKTILSQASIDKLKATKRNNLTILKIITTNVPTTTSTDAMTTSTAQSSTETVQPELDSTNNKQKSTSKTTNPVMTSSIPQAEKAAINDLTEAKPKSSLVNNLDQPNNSEIAKREKQLSQDDKSIVTTEINVSPSLSLEQLNQTSVSTLSHDVPKTTVSSTSRDLNKDITVTKNSQPSSTGYTKTAATTTQAIVSEESTIIPDAIKSEINSTQIATNSNNKNIKTNVDSSSSKLNNTAPIAETIETTTVIPEVTRTEVSSSSISTSKMTTILVYDHERSTTTPSTYVDHFNDMLGSVGDNSGLKHSDKSVDHELTDIFFKTKTKKGIISNSLSERNDLKLDLQKWKELHEKGQSNDLRNLL